MWRKPMYQEYPAVCAAVVCAMIVASACVAVEPAAAQANPPTNTTADRPAKDPPGQSSMPTVAPPASTTQTTGSTNQDPEIKKMNEEEKAKVEKEGK